MNIKKANGYVKLLVVFLVAIILIFAVGIVADGWQQNVTDTPSDNNGESADSDSGKADENKDPENEAQKDETTSDTVIPKYFNYLTGTQTDEALYSKRHKAFIFDSASPLYGISYSDVLIELPIEDGNTRFVSFINDYRGLGKIGALTASRDYISRVAQFFGGIIVSMGEDSSINNNTQSAYKEAIDLSEHKAHFYTEYNIFNYTNGSLFEGAVLSCGFQDNRKSDTTLPYVFADYESEKITLKNQVGSVKLQFSEKHSTELYFSSIENKYSLLKNGAVKNDLLNSQICYFDNCIVLFADTVTYENERGAQITFNTGGHGKGFYFTGGTYSEITYAATDKGMRFYDSNGEILTVNRGKTYIGYMKSSALEGFKESLSINAEPRQQTN